MGSNAELEEAGGSATAQVEMFGLCGEILNQLPQETQKDIHITIHRDLIAEVFVREGMDRAKMTKIADIQKVVGDNNNNAVAVRDTSGRMYRCLCLKATAETIQEIATAFLAIR